jgi:hypothetical protein
MNILRQISLRLVIVYLLAVPILSLFIEVGWGITHGVLAGLSFGKDPSFNDALTKFANERGIHLSPPEGDSRALTNRLSDKDRAELERITAEHVRKHKVVSFGSTFFASALAFGLVGLLTAMLTGSWIFVGLLPLTSFVLNNPIRRYAIIDDIPFEEKLLVALLAQFGASYLFAYLGAKLRIRKTQEHYTISG